MPDHTRALQQVVHAAVGTPDERRAGQDERRVSWADVMRLAGLLDDKAGGKTHRAEPGFRNDG